MADDASHGVATRTLRGMAWAYGSYVGGKLLVLLSTAILARVLTPEEFGLVALALTFMALLEGVSDLGLSGALVIQRVEVLHERAETVFVSTIAMGLVLSLAIVALSPLAEAFFGEPGLAGLTAVLGANFFLRSLGATHYALAMKGLNFRARTVAEVAGVIARGLTGIALALAGFGAWSLVIGYLVGTLALDVAIWAMVPWRPKLEPRREHFGEMVRFGGTLSGVDVVTALTTNADYAFIGRVLGATALGLYTLGFRLPELLIINISVVASHVLFPAFTIVDPDSLGHAFLTSLRYTVMIGLLLATGLAILAEPLIVITFGDQWLGSVTAMQILTVYALGITIGIPAGTAYKATGRAGVLLILGIVRFAALVTGLLLFTDLGINAVATCQATVAGLAAVVGLGLASRLLGVGLAPILREIWPSVVAAGVMAAALIGVDQVVHGDLPVLLAGAGAGAGAYLGTVWVVRPDWIRYLRTRLLARPEVPEPPPAGELEPTRETDVIA